MTALLPPLASATILGLGLWAAVAWVLHQIRAADQPLTATIDDILTDPTTLCGVIVPTPCTNPWTVHVHGWRMCDHHAAPFHAHATEREQLLDIEAHWEATNHHGVNHIEALANGLVDL